MSSLSEKLKALPQKPGVYLFKDKSGAVIYVGKAKALRRRVASYFKPNPELKVSILVSKLRDIDYLTAVSELDALILENELIKKYRPRYNVALRDDKSYPFLKLTVKEAWPRLLLARRREEDGALYFGRFQGGMVRAVIRLVKKLFPIRWCRETPLKKREQPCLYFHIGACAGPCVDRISRRDYHSLVEGIKLLLSGKTEAALARLEAEMKKAAAAQDFERAKYFRDSSQLLQKMMAGKENLSRAPLPQALGDVTELQRALQLPRPPMRLECFDISNIQGTNIVGSMVTFLGGVPRKSDYRRFKIRSVVGRPNDVQAIYEVVKRRYGGSLAKKMVKPDLVMVDGGPAQVAFGRKALLSTGCADLPLIGLAKREEEIFFPGKSQPLRLPKNSAALRLLQRARDAAHRFAVTFHRQRRRQAFFG